MIKILWDTKFSVGHERIDHEHQVFLNLIRNISLMDDQDSSQHDRIFRTLKEIHKYAEFHFLSEENIMLDVSYPEYEIHKKEHEHLLAQLSDQIYAFTHEESRLESLVEFLFEWFAMHTTDIDKRLARYIAQH
jgi:hemerythrin